MLGFLRIGLFGVCRDGGACEASCDASTTALAEEESTTVLGAQPAVTLGPGCGTEDRAMVPSSASATKSRRPSGVQDCICGEAAQADRGGATCDEKVSPIIHEAMSTFVRTLVRGICIEVLLDDGSVIFPQTSLNSEMTHLTLDVNEAQRAIPLQDVESVATSTELRTKNILTSIQPYLDERCCTLVLRGFEFVTFRLDNERHREYFAACLALLITRRDNAAVSKVAPASLDQAHVATVPTPMSADAGAGVRHCSVAAIQATQVTNEAS